MLGNVDAHFEMGRVFGAQMGWGDHCPLNYIGLIGDRMWVIGLDVTVGGAQRSDAAPVLDWMATALGADGPPALIFQHQHPFLCDIDVKDRNNCRN
ncbi:MAG: hypothetical protein MO846_04580 [Candidatus Devosia symbiotica]|nr:hypothetical protein [Candidatus Devosia symbiotica]